MKEIQVKGLGNCPLYDIQVTRKWVLQLRDVISAKSPGITELNDGKFRAIQRDWVSDPNLTLREAQPRESESSHNVVFKINPKHQNK